MNRTWLEIVFPAALSLLVITIGVLLLSMTGVLFEPEPATPTDAVAATSNPPATPDSMALAAAPTPEVAAGNVLFKNNCAQCHAVNDVVVGPALAGIKKRRSEKWLVSWVKNSSKLVASGDEYAVKVYTQYQKQQMPSFNLSEEEIKQILTYIEAEEGLVGAYASTHY